MTVKVSKECWNPDDCQMVNDGKYDFFRTKLILSRCCSYAWCWCLVFFFLCIFQFFLEEVDITQKGNEMWFEKYRYEIPVFYLNGSFLMKHRVNEQLLGEKLEKCETSLWENTEKHSLQTALALNLLLGHPVFWQNVFLFVVYNVLNYASTKCVL